MLRFVVARGCRVTCATVARSAAPRAAAPVSLAARRALATTSVAAAGSPVVAMPVVAAAGSAELPLRQFSSVRSSVTRIVSAASTESVARSLRHYTALPPHTRLVMPALSPSMLQGNIVSWSVKEGDKVSAGQVLADIETDKAVMAWEATDDGYVAKLLVPNGTEAIPVGTLVAIIVEDKASVAQFANFTATAAAPAPAAPVPAAPAAPVPAAPAPKAAAPAPAAAPVISPKAPAAAGGAAFARVIASPRAKVLAAENGVNLVGLAGSGPSGRIVQSDVLAAVAAAPQQVQSVSQTLPSTEGDFIDLPVSNIRKVIASRLLESKTTIPHYYLTTECFVDELLRIRQELNAKGDVKISVNDFIIKASSLALKKVPEVNSSWASSVIRQYNHVSINVAISTDQGLFSPLIPNVDRLGLADISSSVRSLADKAKINRLHPKDLESGTFTISNLGMFGIKHFSAVINPPQACILATGGVEKRVVVNEAKRADSDPEFKVASVMSATLSCDHRVVDGAVGAKWLQHFKRYLEDPMSMLL